ncbi:MAG: hypothetical protein LBR40_01760 [Bacilli bacterium]|jgi:D-tyrosyl-tRNA(Tyr) deacylase|nr:hypothetical protein [Bacilli bacterium]
MKALFIICNNPNFDLVGYHAFNYFKEHYLLMLDKIDDELNVKTYKYKKDDNEYYFLLTCDHVMHHLKKYVNFLNDNFNDVDIVVHINYHAGANALDNILTVHKVGDIASATFLPSMPMEATRLLLSLKKYNDELNLGFTITTETTHYSGVASGSDPKELYEFKKPTYDLEIGSTTQAYENKKAIIALCESAMRIFDKNFETRLNVIYLGGPFFENTYTEAILRNTYPIYYDNHLCQMMLEDIDYLNNSKELIIDIIKKSFQTVDLIVYHDKVRKIKPILDEIYKEYGIPNVKHRALRNVNENPELLKIFREKMSRV